MDESPYIRADEPPYIHELPKDLRDYLREDDIYGGPRWLGQSASYIQCLLLARILKRLEKGEVA